MSRMKSCTKCLQIKAIDEFYFIGPENRWHSWCRPCMNRARVELGRTPLGRLRNGLNNARCLLRKAKTERSRARIAARLARYERLIAESKAVATDLREVA